MSTHKYPSILLCNGGFWVLRIKSRAYACLSISAHLLLGTWLMNSKAPSHRLTSSDTSVTKSPSRNHLPVLHNRCDIPRSGPSTKYIRLSPPTIAASSRDSSTFSVEPFYKNASKVGTFSTFENIPPSLPTRH